MAELTTLARPYAKAAFGYALANNELSNWSAMLITLANVASNDKVKAVLTSPALTSEQQVATVVEIMADELSDKGKNFVALLADNKRILLLPAISEQFEILKAQQEKLSNVTIDTAFAIDSELEANLAKALEKKLNCSVSINTTVDSNLIGGAVIRAGDLVIDSSVRGRLAKLTESVNS
jgi:F-type H+-transporting ATPase subunit delta